MALTTAEKISIFDMFDITYPITGSQNVINIMEPTKRGGLLIGGRWQLITNNDILDFIQTNIDSPPQVDTAFQERARNLVQQWDALPEAPIELIVPGSQVGQVLNAKYKSESHRALIRKQMQHLIPYYTPEEYQTNCVELAQSSNPGSFMCVRA